MTKKTQRSFYAPCIFQILAYSDLHFFLSVVKLFSCLYSTDYNFQCFLVPDVIITASLANLNVKLTSDFYRLLRGFLLMNLGDSLVPTSETIPIEVLQKPTELHASFQLKFLTLFYCS